MAESKVPGGAYLSADGETWHDANGKVIPAPAGESKSKVKPAGEQKPTSEVKPISGESKSS